MKIVVYYKPEATDWGDKSMPYLYDEVTQEDVGACPALSEGIETSWYTPEDIITYKLPTEEKFRELFRYVAEWSGDEVFEELAEASYAGVIGRIWAHYTHQVMDRYQVRVISAIEGDKNLKTSVRDRMVKNWFTFFEALQYAREGYARMK